MTNKDTPNFIYPFYSKICGICGGINPNYAKYCGDCGTSFIITRLRQDDKSPDKETE
jgi:ribosomal protein L40E